MDSKPKRIANTISIFNVTNTLRRFIIPVILIIITSIFFASYITVENYEIQLVLGRLCSCFAVGICWSTAGSLVSEAALGDRKKLVVSSLSALLASGLAFWINRYYCWIGLCISALFLCAYLCSCKGDQNQKAGQFLSAFFAAVVTFLTLLIAALMLFPTANRLLEQQMFFLSKVVRLLVLTPVIILPPIVMLGLMPKPGSTVTKEKIPLQLVLSWTILPVYLVLVLALTVYIAIIIVKWELPVGQINPFAIALLMTYTILSSVLTGNENKLAEWFMKWGALPLLPIIIVQAVAVSIRINAYGFTAFRILGIVLSGVCLIQFVFGVLRKRMVIVPLIAAVLAFVLTATPLNAWSLARRAQDIRLYNALIRADMIDSNGKVIPNPNATEEDIETIRSAFAMLSNDTDLQADTQAYRIIQRIKKNYAPYSISYEIVLGFPYIPPKTTNIFTIFFPDPDDYWGLGAEYKRPSFNVYRYASEDEVDATGFSDAKFVGSKLEKINGYQSEIDGYIISLDRISEIVDFSKSELGSGDILMEDGTVFRICLIVEVLTTSQPEYYCMFWMLMP